MAHFSAHKLVAAFLLIVLAAILGTIGFGIWWIYFEYDSDKAIKDRLQYHRDSILQIGLDDHESSFLGHFKDEGVIADCASYLSRRNSMCFAMWKNTSTGFGAMFISELHADTREWVTTSWDQITPILAEVAYCRYRPAENTTPPIEVCVENTELAEPALVEILKPLRALWPSVLPEHVRDLRLE